MKTYLFALFLIVICISFQLSKQEILNLSALSLTNFAKSDGGDCQWILYSHWDEEGVDGEGCRVIYGCDGQFCMPAETIITVLCHQEVRICDPA